jgi:hypothetical protein
VAIYNKINTYKNPPNQNYGNLNNANEKRNIVKNEDKNIVKNNSDDLINQNQNQHNEFKNKKEIINFEREKEGKNERDKIDLQNVDIINNRNNRLPIKQFRRLNTKQENYNKIPINIKMSENVAFYNKKINYMNNEIDENSNIKYLNSVPDRKEKDINENKIYESINKIFFYDYQQKYIQDKKINEYQIEELKKLIFNDKMKGKNFLKNYYMNFIEKNILPLFKKNIDQSKLDIIKYNISIILECLEMDKNYYNGYYLQNYAKEKKFNRKQSREAVLRFRKEFNINNDDITDEALEKKINKNCGNE